MHKMDPLAIQKKVVANKILIDKIYVYKILLVKKFLRGVVVLTRFSKTISSTWISLNSSERKKKTSLRI